jgi:hypothetical protein
MNNYHKNLTINAWLDKRIDSHTLLIHIQNYQYRSRSKQ